MWKHNLSGGAIPEIIQNKELEKQIHQIVKQTAKALNLRFASIDVIQTKTEEKGIYFLHIYSERSVQKFEKKKKIYGVDRYSRKIYFLDL